MYEGAEGNSNGFTESITVSEAAQRLGVTLPRLTRLLKRPEFAAHIAKAERQTKTGTRTVTLVDVTILETLRLTLSEHKHEQNEPNRYLSDEGGQLPALAVRLLEEREARLTDKDAEIARLMQTLTVTQTALSQALEGLAREQGLRALLSPDPVPNKGIWEKLKRLFQRGDG